LATFTKSLAPFCRQLQILQGNLEFDPSVALGIRNLPYIFSKVLVTLPEGRNILLETPAKDARSLFCDARVPNNQADVRCRFGINQGALKRKLRI
jgi:hypothetical protein